MPILAGTSWAGVLRSRATQIARTLAPAKDHDRFLAGMFGPAEIIERRRRRQRNENIRASRLEVAESEISGGHLLEQTRVKIDRFTGGAAEAAGGVEGDRPAVIGMEHDMVVRVAQARVVVKLADLLLRVLVAGEAGEVGVVTAEQAVVLGVVRRVASEVVVLQDGRIAAYGPISKVFSPPLHYHTQLLLQSVPQLRIDWLTDVLRERRDSA